MYEDVSIFAILILFSE